MEGKEAVKKAKKNELVVWQRVLGILLLVIGVMMTIGGFGKMHELWAGAIGAFTLSAIVFGIKTITVAALTYIYKNE